MNATDQDGFTLTEMLAALLIVGLAMGGLAQAGFTIAKLQSIGASKNGTLQASRRLQNRFQALLEGRGPFRSDDPRFQGEEDHFEFPCGAVSCSAVLQRTSKDTTLEIRQASSLDADLGPLHAAHFVYVGSSSMGDVWPPASPARQRLQAILLMSQDGIGPHPLAAARVWRQEEASCRFDAIIKDCRAQS